MITSANPSGPPNSRSFYKSGRSSNDSGRLVTASGSRPKSARGPVRRGGSATKDTPAPARRVRPWRRPAEKETAAVRPPRLKCWFGVRRGGAGSWLPGRGARALAGSILTNRRSEVVFRQVIQRQQHARAGTARSHHQRRASIPVLHDLQLDEVG